MHNRSTDAQIHKYDGFQTARKYRLGLFDQTNVVLFTVNRNLITPDIHFFTECHQ